MGRRGPKPKTVEQLRVIGSHAPKQKRGSVGDGEPKCPTNLSTGAKKHWRRLVPQLVAAGVVGELDCDSLGRYCQLRTRLDEAESKIAEQGAVIMYANGNEGKSPWVTISLELSRLLIQLEKELGLTPYARQSIKPTSHTKTEEPAAKYFG